MGLQPLSRTAGEGGQRSEPGEGSASTESFSERGARGRAGLAQAISLIDDDSDQLIRGAPSTGFGQRGAKYRCSGFVRCRDADFQSGGAGAHRGRADSINRKDRQ